MLQTGFHDILNEGYTAALEVQLDEIEDGKIEWKQAVADFDVKFSKDLETAGEQMPNVKKDGIPLDEKCPECGSGLLMRFGRFGPFISCSTYPECKYTRNVDEAPAEASAAANGAEEEVPPCEVCGKPMALKRSRFGTFYGCTGYPECKNIRKTGPKPSAPIPTGVPCPGVRQGGDRREEVPPRQDLLVLQPLSGLQVLALEEAGRPRVPAVRRQIPPGEGHQEARHSVRLQHRRVRLRRGRRAGRSHRPGLTAFPLPFQPFPFQQSLFPARERPLGNGERLFRLGFEPRCEPGARAAASGLFLRSKGLRSL